MTRSKTQRDSASSPRERKGGAAGNGDAAQTLNELRASLSKLVACPVASAPGSDCPGDLTALLPTLSSSLEQLMTEHQGMADELLCLYEQLGIIFEITRKLAGVQNESDVLDLFLDSLRRSFAGREVFAARRRSRGWVLEGSSTPVHDWLGGLLDRAESAEADRRVIVERASPEGTADDIAEAMIASVISGEAACSNNKARWCSGRRKPVSQQCSNSSADGRYIVHYSAGTVNVGSVGSVTATSRSQPSFSSLSV